MRRKSGYSLIFTVGILLSHSAFLSGQDNNYENKSMDELAKELANPNTPLTSLKFKNQFRTYKGDIAGATDQGSYIMLFQSTLPFPFKSGRTLWIRPSVPIIIGHPYYTEGFDSYSGLGEIVLDFQYGDTGTKGFLWSVGATGTIPTATKTELGRNSWTLGPGLQLGHISKIYVVGAFINHQWGFSNSNSNGYSLTTLQVFNVFLPTGGWSVASGPIISYNHSADQWEFPINLAVGKTVKINSRPWKFAVELNYYVSNYGTFGPQWMIGVNIAPVVKNVIANCIK
jgi:hypothetical protein